MRRNRSRGYTLTEMLIVVAIVGIVMTIGPSLLKDITRFSRMNTARVETQRSARVTLSQINRTLRQAQSSTIVISQEIGQPPCSRIAFSTIDGRDVAYFQRGTELRMVTGGSEGLLAEGLRYLAFTHPRTDDGAIVSVSLTFERATYEGGTKALQMAIEKVRIMND